MCRYVVSGHYLFKVHVTLIHQMLPDSQGSASLVCRAFRWMTELMANIPRLADVLMKRHFEGGNTRVTWEAHSVSAIEAGTSAATFTAAVINESARFREGHAAANRTAAEKL